MAPVDLNKNKKVILESHKEVFDLNSKINWALYGYEGQSDVLNLVNKGDGGLEEFVGELNSGRIQYGYLKIIDPNSKLPKFVFVNWQGEGVPENKKGSCASHLKDVTSLLRGAHVTINARREDDLDESDVISKVAKSSGANYGFHREVSKEIPVAEPVGSVYQKVKPQIEIKPQLREKFWEDTAKEQKDWKAEEGLRKQTEKEKLEKEIKDRELRNAKEREAKENERFKGIKEMKAAEQTADSHKSDQKTWTDDAASDEAERAKRSEQMKKERAAEAQKLIGSRGTNNKNVFEQTRDSQFEKKSAAAPPKKVIRDLPQIAPTPSVPVVVPKDINSEQQAKQVDEKKEDEYEDLYDDAQCIKPDNPLPVASSTSVQSPALGLLAQNLPKRPVSDDEEDWNTEENQDQDLYDDVSSTMSQLKPAASPVASPATSPAVADPSSGPSARALYDYQAAEDNELSFDPGDLITNIDMVDDGWWVGDFQGNRGMFPSNYVEIIS